MNESVVGFCGFNVFESVPSDGKCCGYCKQRAAYTLCRLYIVGAQQTDTRNMITLHYLPLNELGFILLEN